MYLIDLVYRTVLSIANSDVRGNVKPSDARLLINTTIEEIYESYFFELNRMLNRQNRGLVGNGIENIPDRIREKLNFFLVTDFEVSKNNDVYDLPSDLRYLESVEADNTIVELIKSNTEFNSVKSIARRICPIGFKNNYSIKVFPDAFTTVRVSYLRNVKIPNWTYVVVNGTEIFNPSASDFQELDLHPSEVSNVIIKTLFKVGINLKEQDLQQVMQQQKQIEFNEEMQS